ncbi:helix-turn-helix transcriptional regulator [Halobacillus sp. A5]|uniref:ArsR/SmtB family transcription factor n=1 Tax=Halobacillus sp. A5 TaxID=2880263 RepID=UPI0020A6C632|nr:metalloregulator ArsR/SmtB family transcription factor [Halobacillus sp. A5]MCP3028513.1 metalloregulator ArsR/SmtB family transcription factor [Halobacillus sp. A5]
MVNYNNDEELNAIFHALADSTRREMIHMLSQKESTVSELAVPFDMSLAAVSKHIKVLERANLVERSVKGRVHSCRLNAGSLEKITAWLNMYERFWSKRFDVLEEELLKAKKKEH